MAISKKISDDVQTAAKKSHNMKKYYWNDLCYGASHSLLSKEDYIVDIKRVIDSFSKLNDYSNYLQQYQTLYDKYVQVLSEKSNYQTIGTSNKKIARKKALWSVKQITSMASESAMEDFYESITDSDKKDLVKLYMSSIKCLSNYYDLSISEIIATNSSHTITEFVSKAKISDELKRYGIIFGEDNPGNQGTGECERLTIETQNKITAKMNSVLPSAQEKIESGTPTSSFESSVDTAKNKKELEDLQKAFGMGGSNEQDSLQVNTTELSKQIQSYVVDLSAEPTLTTVQESDPEAAELLRGKQLAYAEKYGQSTTLNTSTSVDTNLTSEAAAFMDDLMDANDNHPGLAKTILNNFNFTSETSDYTIATDEQVQNKEDYLAAKKAISEAKTQMFQEGLGCATNIVSNAINLAFQGTAAWAQCKSLYSKEGLKEIWEEIQDATWGTLKTYGKQKVSELQQEIIQLPIEATSYAVSRITYYTSYFTTEIMQEVNLSKIMTTEEIKRTEKTNVLKEQEKQEAVEKSLEKVTETVSKINAEVDKISGFIANGMSYVVEAPTILIKYLDNIMDMGFSYTDRFYDMAIEDAENIIYKEIDISSKAIGNFAAAKIVAPLKVQLQDTMSQINVMKAKAIVKNAAAIATALSQIAAQLGL
jgi:hypothetical protein